MYESVGQMLKPFLILMASRGLVITLCFIAVAVFVAVDYYFGIQKAKQNNIPISSDKMRKTIDKGIGYILVMSGAVFVDLVQMFSVYIINQENGFNIVTIPVVTVIMTLFNCYIEYKSIKESASVKYKKLEASAKKDLKELIKLYQQLKQDGAFGEQE